MTLGTNGYKRIVKDTLRCLENLIDTEEGTGEDTRGRGGVIILGLVALARHV